MVKTVSESAQIKKVSTFSELETANFQGENNAICWDRNLDGNFEEIVSKLELKENITEVSIEDLLELKLSKKGSVARGIILSDLSLLTDFGALPSLNLIKNYERDTEIEFISRDVYSYHVDHSPIATSTFLCTYFGASGDILANNEAEQKILIPEIRKKLEDLYEGREEDFENFLQENYFDLHYLPKPKANPVNLGVGNLWRLSVDHPEQQVLPCIHRAPLENAGEYRLLLIC